MRTRRPHDAELGPQSTSQEGCGSGAVRIVWCHQRIKDALRPRLAAQRGSDPGCDIEIQGKVRSGACHVSKFLRSSLVSLELHEGFRHRPNRRRLLSECIEAFGRYEAGIRAFARRRRRALSRWNLVRIIIAEAHTPSLVIASEDDQSVVSALGEVSDGIERSAQLEHLRQDPPRIVVVGREVYLPRFDHEDKTVLIVEKRESLGRHGGEAGLLVLSLSESIVHEVRREQTEQWCGVRLFEFAGALNDDESLRAGFVE